MNFHKNLFGDANFQAYKDLRVCRYYLDAINSMVDNQSYDHANNLMISLISTLMSVQEEIKRVHKEQLKKD